MTNQITRNTKENSRKRLLAAVTQEVISSDDDENVTDGMDICNLIENQINQRKQIKTSSALHALGETIRNTLLEINEVREQNRERRHKELLQILTKMAQQDNDTICEGTNSSLSVNFDQQTSPYESIAGQDYTERDDMCIVNDFESKNCTPTTTSNEIDQIYLDCSGTTKEGAPMNYKIRDQTQISKTKTVTAVKSNEKKELEKMRAKMLELQRKKMEDRERKKRGFVEIENV